MKNRKGVSVIAVVITMMLVLMISLTAASLIGISARSAADNQISLKAFYIAEAGIQHYMKQLSADPDWSVPPSGGSKSFSGGSFNISWSGASKDKITVVSTGTLPVGGKNYTRTVRTTVDRNPWGFTGNYILYPLAVNTGASPTNITFVYLTGGDMLLGNDVRVFAALGSGDVQSTGSVYKPGWFTWRRDSANSDQSIASNLPILNTSPYDSELAIASSYSPAGTVTLSGNQTLSGYTYINGDLVIDSSAKINAGSVPPTIVVTGNITMNGGTYSNRTVIADGIKMISGGSTIIGGPVADTNNYVRIGSGNVLYSSDGFLARGLSYTAGASGDGNGASFITPQDFNGSLGGDMYGLIYCGGELSLTAGTAFHGNIVAGYVDNINISYLALSPTSVNYSSILGLPTTTQMDITDWGEE